LATDVVRRKEDFGIFPAGLADEARGCLPCDVRNRQENPLLKGVSRSFYLSLRFLPKPMRGAASLGYLLARTSDTLADTAALEVEVRRQALVAFRRSLAGSEEAPRWQVSLLNAISDVRERHLLEGSEDLFEWLARLPDGESALVREVVDIIISGQLADIEWFGAATRENPVALADDAALEDYTWRVAGLFGGVLAHVLADLHRAEMRAAHRAEVGGFRAVLRQGFVVELAGGLGIEAEIELVFPAEFEAGL
jgi:phytoene/squalene synthetase